MNSKCVFTVYIIMTAQYKILNTEFYTQYVDFLLLFFFKFLIGQASSDRKMGLEFVLKAHHCTVTSITVLTHTP